MREGIVRTISAAVRAGEMPRLEAARRSYAVIAEKEPHVGAFTDVAPQGKAFQTVMQYDPGTLAGVPVAVKDIIDTFDMTTGWGSPLYGGAVADRDAAAVALMRHEGAVIIGKTVSSEFAMWTPGGTVNPYSSSHSPGGSSSGSGAAVAAGMVPVAIGTQTGGSITLPAAFCGVVGYKPTYGTVPRSGLMPLADSLDTIGALGGSVDDVALTTSVMAGRPELGDYEFDGTPRVGVFRMPWWDRAKEETRILLHRIAALMSSRGWVVEEFDAPEPFSDLLDHWKVIAIYECYWNLAHERLGHWGSISAGLRRIMEEAAEISPARYDEAQAAAEAYRIAFDRQEGFDVLLTPSVAGEAVPFGTIGEGIFNRVWTLLHTPTLHVPVTTGPQGLPIGVQLVATRRNDRTLLGVGSHLEALIEESFAKEDR